MMRLILAFSLAALPSLAMAEVPSVVTDIPPIHALVSQVMGDLGTPTLLLEKGADEHDFQLRPSQMQAIAEAKTVIWIGPELTPWLDRAMADTSAQSLPLLALPATQTQNFPEGGLDPHAWLNPANAAIWTDAIAADLSGLDPENAATYAANAKATKARLAALDADLAAQLGAIKAKSFVTFHAAYGYFTTHFGLTQAASLALGDATTPGAAKLAELQTQLQSGSYTCAFPELQHDPALLTQLMQGSTAKLGAALDPVGSSLPFGPDAYDTLLRSIAKTLADCLTP